MLGGSQQTRLTSVTEEAEDKGPDAWLLSHSLALHQPPFPPVGYAPAIPCANHKKNFGLLPLVRLNPMLYILQYGENSIGFNPGVNVRVKFGILHMTLT